MTSSDEGDKKGLNWIKGKSVYFKAPEEERLKIPHLGWNNVDLVQNDNPLFSKFDVVDQFYFAHSYHASEVEASCIATTSDYGSVKFTSSIRKENIFGVQFHPEKSHDQGIKLLKNFIEYSDV